MSRVLFIGIILLFSVQLLAQKNDSVSLKANVITPIDSLPVMRHSPRKATLRSAMIPGWGQAYNKKYWKIPIVYAGVGIPAYLFFDNKKWYNRTREAAKMLGSTPLDTANFRNRVDEKLWIFFTSPNALPSLLNYRNEFRRNMDYSLLFVLVFWGLNVVDATVDAHLKEFDVSDDLSIRIKPTILQGTTTAGVSMVFTFGRNQSKTITSLR